MKAVLGQEKGRERGRGGKLRQKGTYDVLIFLGIVGYFGNCNGTADVFAVF